MPGEKVTEAERGFFSEWGPGLAIVVYGAEDALDKLAEIEKGRRP